jgi:hypothetical protein
MKMLSGQIHSQELTLLYKIFYSVLHGRGPVCWHFAVTSSFLTFFNCFGWQWSTSLWDLSLFILFQYVQYFLCNNLSLHFFNNYLIHSLTLCVLIFSNMVHCWKLLNLIPSLSVLLYIRSSWTSLQSARMATIS